MPKCARVCVGGGFFKDILKVGISCIFNMTLYACRAFVGQLTMLFSGCFMGSGGEAIKKREICSKRADHFLRMFATCNQKAKPFTY